MSRAGPAPGHAHACDQTCESCLTMFGTILREGTYQHCLLPTSTFLLFICAKIEIFVFSADIQITHWWRLSLPNNVTHRLHVWLYCDSLAWVPGPRRLLNKRLGRRTDDRNNQESWIIVPTVRRRRVIVVKSMITSILCTAGIIRHVAGSRGRLGRVFA